METGRERGPHGSAASPGPVGSTGSAFLLMLLIGVGGILSNTRLALWEPTFACVCEPAGNCVQMLMLTSQLGGAQDFAFLTNSQVVWDHSLCTITMVKYTEKLLKGGKPN